MRLSVVSMIPSIIRRRRVILSDGPDTAALSGSAIGVQRLPRG